MTDSLEWSKIVDKAYEDAKDCASCQKVSVITLPAHIEVHDDDFTTLIPAHSYCCDPECDYNSLTTEYPGLRHPCTCIRCQPRSQSSDDWCYELAGEIDENGDPI